MVLAFLSSLTSLLSCQIVVGHYFLPAHFVEYTRAPVVMVLHAILAFAAYGCEGIAAAPAPVVEQDLGFALYRGPVEVDPL